MRASQPQCPRRCRRSSSSSSSTAHMCSSACRCLLLRLSLHMLCGPLSLADGMDTIQHKCAPVDC